MFSVWIRAFIQSLPYVWALTFIPGPSPILHNKSAYTCEYMNASELMYIFLWNWQPGERCLGWRSSRQARQWLKSQKEVLATQQMIPSSISGTTYLPLSIPLLPPLDKNDLGRSRWTLLHLRTLPSWSWGSLCPHQYCPSATPSGPGTQALALRPDPCHFGRGEPRERRGAGTSPPPCLWHSFPEIGDMAAPLHAPPEPRWGTPVLLLWTVLSETPRKETEHQQEPWQARPGKDWFIAGKEDTQFLNGVLNKYFKWHSRSGKELIFLLEYLYK